MEYLELSEKERKTGVAGCQSTAFIPHSSKPGLTYTRGALPFSKYLYYISPSQRIPSRGVWFSAFFAVLLGLIPLAGPTASGALFSLIVIGQYVCITTVIYARWFGPTEFQPGPVNLGTMSLPVSIVAVVFMTVMFVVLCFPFELELTPNTVNYSAALVFGVVVFLATFCYLCPGIRGHY
ncbi:hypothetical protein PM082_010288 [Marasmius tenuissimus]|nr:hypothetical protein PM082_010288 [Marasmius tenuissimus]